MKILAKPSGISLKDHVTHVQEQADLIFESWPFLHQKYAHLIKGASLREAVKQAVEWHDEGKKINLWQDACQKDYALYIEWRKQKGLAPDTVSTTDYLRYEQELRSANKSTGANILKAGFRHEFGSLKVAEDKKANLSLAVKAAIAAHHSKLSIKYEERWTKKDGNGAFKNYWKEFVRHDYNYARNEMDQWEKRVLAKYEVAALRTLLRLADTRASRLESGGELAQISRFSYNFPAHYALRGVQKKALELASEQISILRAPTGSGKTDASLLWGKEQIEPKLSNEQKADRLIIAMPTRFTSNALALNIEKNVGDTGLYHSSAWYTRFGEVEAKKKSFAKELHRMAQLFATPITVCTVDHLLISLTGTNENHFGSYFFLANSAVVFDEADFYDPFVQANLTVLIETLKVLKVPVLIMSATVPDSAGKLYGVNSRIQESESESINPGRALAWAGKAEKAKEVEAILQQMMAKGTGIIYANTVERALSYYNYFKQNPNAPVPILYHSRFTEPDKKLIEEKLLNALGREAWEKDKAKGIAILTQIGEMSINISASIMLSDVCPWDRLAQRVGRLNRFAKDKQGIAYIVAPHKKGEVYVAPYGSIENRKWIPAEAFTNTYNQIKEKLEDKGIVSIASTDFVEYVNGLYPDLPNFSVKARTNKESLIKLMNQNWLIIPDRKTDEEAGTVSAEWSSRNIEEHRIIFVEAPQDFETYEDYQAFALEYGVSCPIWIVNKELRKPEDQRRIMTLVRRINDEQMTFYYTDSYNSTEGLSFFYAADDQSEDDF